MGMGTGRAKECMKRRGGGDGSVKLNLLFGRSGEGGVLTLW